MRLMKAHNKCSYFLAQVDKTLLKILTLIFVPSSQQRLGQKARRFFIFTVLVHNVRAEAWDWLRKVIDPFHETLCSVLM
jgi:hypothetical protein